MPFTRAKRLPCVRMSPTRQGRLRCRQAGRGGAAGAGARRVRARKRHRRSGCRPCSARGQRGEQRGAPGKGGEAWVGGCPLLRGALLSAWQNPGLARCAPTVPAQPMLLPLRGNAPPPVHPWPSRRLQSDGGMKTSLGSLQQAVGQLRTAVVALELRPPLGDAAQSGASCLQVGVRLGRAVEWGRGCRHPGCGELARHICSAPASLACPGVRRLRTHGMPVCTPQPWVHGRPPAAVARAGAGGAEARGGGHSAAARPAGRGPGLGGGGRRGRPRVPPKGAGRAGPVWAAGQHAARGGPRAAGAAAGRQPAGQRGAAAPQLAAALRCRWQRQRASRDSRAGSSRGSSRSR